MKSVVVYCGSKAGDGDYIKAAQLLGQELTKQGIRLIYGGGSTGLMGVVAHTVMSLGGEVVGIIPDCLNSTEIANNNITELHIVPDMHSRKKMMADLADAAIVLPGGFGTFEECFEFVTWSQLDLHQKPCGLLNIKGYYDLLLQFVDQTVTSGFVHSDHRPLLLDSTSPQELIRMLSEWKPIHKPAASYVSIYTPTEEVIIS